MIQSDNLNLQVLYIIKITSLYNKPANHSHSFSLAIVFIKYNSDFGMR